MHVQDHYASHAEMKAEELLSSFNTHRVKYLVVGGYTVFFYAARATRDKDLFVKADAANARGVYAALAAFGIPLANIAVDSLADPGKFIRFGREPVAVDILPNVDGVDLDDTWGRRAPAGRMRDLADVEEIQAARAHPPKP